MTLHGELVDSVKWTLCDFYQARPTAGDSNVEYDFAEKIVALVREQIAKDIEADERFIELKSVNDGYLFRPNQEVRAHYANLVRGKG